MTGGVSDEAGLRVKTIPSVKAHASQRLKAKNAPAEASSLLNSNPLMS